MSKCIGRSLNNTFRASQGQEYLDQLAKDYKEDQWKDQNSQLQYIRQKYDMTVQICERKLRQL